MTSATARLLAATGALAAIASGSGFALIGSTPLGGATAPDPTAEAFAAAVAAPAPPAAFVGIALDAFGHVLLTVFVLVLADRVRRVGAPHAGLALAVAVTGAMAVLVTMGDVAALYALAIGAGGALTGEAAGALATLVAGFFVAAWAFGGLFTATAGLAALRTAVLPRWVAMIGLVVGAVAIAALPFPYLAAAQVAGMGIFLWIFVASVALTLRRTPEPEGA